MDEPNIIADIKRRTEERKRVKSRFDKVINLSASKSADNTMKLSAQAAGQTVRLLDEGVVVSGDGYPLFYIKKGVLKAFYEKLPEDYTGSINIGHQEFATFPFLVGQWTKKDLSLVNIGDGRQGLNVKLNLDENSIFVKELRRINYPVGVSAEFYYDLDLEATETLQLEVLSKVDINEFAIVGDAGNVSSGGINLKGDREMPDMTLFEKLFSKKLEAEEKPAEDTMEENAEDAAAGEQEAQEAAETVDAEQALENMLSAMEQLAADNEAKDAQIAELTAQVEKVEAALAARKAGVDEILKKFSASGSEFLKQKKAEKADEKKNLAAYQEQSEDGFGRV